MKKTNDHAFRGNKCLEKLQCKKNLMEYPLKLKIL